MFSEKRGFWSLVLGLWIFACSAMAQSDIEDLPITDVLPTPIAAPTVTPKKAPSVATPQPTIKPIPAPPPTKTAAKATPNKATPTKMAPTATPRNSIEDLSIEDALIEDALIEDAPVTAATQEPAPAPLQTPAKESAPQTHESPEVQQSPEANTQDSHEQPDDHHFEQAHGEPRFPAPDGHTVGWFDLGHTFQIDFLRTALWAGLLVSLMCSFLGVYVVLKRIVFVGVALAELSSAGIAVGLWLGFSPIWGAMLLVLFGVAMFAVRWSPRRVSGESTIGIVYSVAGALAILCVAKSAMGETHMLKLLQGDVLTVAPRETLEMLGIFAAVALIHALFGKEFLLVSFDRDAASTMGYHATRWDFLLYLTIGVVISFSIRATGVLMATTMLIIPAVTALLLAQRMRQVWPLSLLFGVIPVVLGLHLSFLMDLPASAVIVALSFGLLLPILAFSARRS